MEVLSTWEDSSFLNFPVGGTGCPFLRQDLAHVFRSFLLGWMVSPQKASYLLVKDRDREPGFGRTAGGSRQSVSAFSVHVLPQCQGLRQCLCLLPAMPAAPAHSPVLPLHKLTCSLQCWGRWFRGRNFLKQRTSRHTHSNLPLLLVLQRNLELWFAELVADSLLFFVDK